MVFALSGEPNGRPNESHVAFHLIVSLGLKKNVSHIYTLASVLSRTYGKAEVHKFDERSRRPEISHFITSALSNVPISSLRFGVIIITV